MDLNASTGGSPYSRGRRGSQKVPEKKEAPWGAVHYSPRVAASPVSAERKGGSESEKGAAGTDAAAAAAAMRCTGVALAGGGDVATALAIDIRYGGAPGAWDGGATKKVLLLPPLPPGLCPDMDEPTATEAAAAAAEGALALLLLLLLRGGVSMRCNAPVTGERGPCSTILEYLEAAACWAIAAPPASCCCCCWSRELPPPPTPRAAADGVAVAKGDGRLPPPAVSGVPALPPLTLEAPSPKNVSKKGTTNVGACAAACCCGEVDASSPAAAAEAVVVPSGRRALAASAVNDCAAGIGAAAAAKGERDAKWGLVASEDDDEFATPPPAPCSSAEGGADVIKGASPATFAPPTPLPSMPLRPAA